MFTGIVEELGEISRVESSDKGLRLTIKLENPQKEDKVGDSVNINGACQTIVNIDPKGFTVEASPETISKTDFSTFKMGSKVNIERALKVSDRLGGHIVSGHVETTAKVKKIVQEGFSKIFTFVLVDDLMRYIIYKGSITISGISLTVIDVNDKEKSFNVMIIPHTESSTTFQDLKIGDIVNIETDILGKYVEKLLAWKDNNITSSSVITESLLKENGFV